MKRVSDHVLAKGLPRALCLAAAMLLFVRPIPAGAADEKDLTLATKIVSATIYADRAQVTRTGSIALSAGLHTLVCDDLPRGFAEPSLQVEGRGTAQARIMGVDVVKVRGLAADSPRYKELKAKLEKLTAARDTLQIELASLNGSAQFLDSYAKFPFEKGEAKLTTEIFRVQDWKNVIEFIGAERVKTNEKVDGVNKRIAKLTEDINWITNELAAMQTKDDWSKRVVVDCDIVTPGDLELSFTYNVPGAAWGSEYTIRYDTAKESIDLAYNARIQQSTGEDWKAVEIVLSTARPQLGAAPPEITPLYLQRVPRPRVMADVASAVALKSGRVSGNALEARQMPSPAPAQEYEAVQPGAELASNEFAATFAIPKRVDLASGSDPRRVLILEDKLTGKLSRYTAPRLSQNVFVKGSVTNTLSAPLLAGPAEVYIESQPTGAQGKTSSFVGKEILAPVAIGQEFPVHLGIDQDMKVTHKLEKKEHITKEGASVRKIRYSYLITLESFKKGAVDLALQDRIPVSTMKEIRVSDVDFAPGPAVEREDGVITWNLAPAPKQKIEIRIAYTIEFPGDWDENMLNLE
jgi:uncharacterized protein (TIGR02231 family)